MIIYFISIDFILFPLDKCRTLSALRELLIIYMFRIDPTDPICGVRRVVFCDIDENMQIYNEFQGESRRWVLVQLHPRRVDSVAKADIHPENSLLAVPARRLSTRLQEVFAVTGHG